jgi:hypothetical protein
MISSKYKCRPIFNLLYFGRARVNDQTDATTWQISLVNTSAGGLESLLLRNALPDAYAWCGCVADIEQRSRSTSLLFRARVGGSSLAERGRKIRPAFPDSLLTAFNEICLAHGTCPEPLRK